MDFSRRQQLRNKNPTSVEHRVLRRSIEQKENRAKAINRLRRLNEKMESELEPISETQRVNPKCEGEKLQRWKKEKEAKKMLKKKLEKPSFKICKIKESQPVFLFSDHYVIEPIKKNAAKPPSFGPRVVTRSMARAEESVKVKTNPDRRLPVLGSGSSKMGPISARKDKKPLSNAVMGKLKKVEFVEEHTSASNKTKKRETSFAPPDFQFTAPEGLESYEQLARTVMDFSCQTKIQSRGNTPKEDIATLSVPGGEICDEQYSPMLETTLFITRTRGSSSRKKLRSSNLDKSDGLSELDSPSSVKVRLGQTFNTVDERLAVTVNVPECAPASPLPETCKLSESVANKMTVSDDETQQTAQSPREKSTKASMGNSLTPSYFRDLLASQTQLLKSLCEEWNPYLENGKIQNENVIGRIRTTIGQSELLMAERFQQFSSLIDDCEFQRGEKPTTCVDLQGFWEMIYFQIEDVTEKFKKLERIKAHNFIEQPTPIKKIVSKRHINKRKVKEPQMKEELDSRNMTRSQAARQRLAEAKAKAAAIKLQSFGSSEATGGILKGSPATLQTNASKCLYKSTLIEETENVCQELIPLPVLKDLAITSPPSSADMRLSQLFSPLRNRTNDAKERNPKMVVNEANTRGVKDVVSIKKDYRSMNLIRFSEVFSPTLEDDQENA